jgi:hypothetical protein
LIRVAPRPSPATAGGRFTGVAAIPLMGQDLFRKDKCVPTDFASRAMH